jgi:hypothetical protein
MFLSEAVKSTGFYHQKGFLSADEIQQLKKIYDATNSGTNGNYPIREVWDCSVFSKSILDKIQRVQKYCFPEEELVLHAAMFFTVVPGDPKKSVNFYFHQDHESYFIFQEHFRYLNLYVILDKEDVENSNLTLVPFDAVKKHDPKMHDMLVGGGATSFRDGYLVNDNFSSAYKLTFNVENVSVTPKLGVGDLLLMRGDIVHRTQNQKAGRIAVSFRAISKTAVANRRALMNCSYNKLMYMKNNATLYWAIDEVYSQAGTDFLTANELCQELAIIANRFRREKPIMSVVEKIQLAKFKLKVWFLMKFCRIFNVGMAAV